GTLGRALNVGNPNGLPWTWVMEHLTALADGITVASRFLEQRFGGTLIPHVRDADAWQPDPIAPVEARRRLGMGQGRVVTFLGTPRGYKGLEDLCAAMRRLGRSDVVLAAVGADARSDGSRALAARYPEVRLTGRIPFADVPRYLAAADVVAIPQRDTSDTR